MGSCRCGCRPQLCCHSLSELLIPEILFLDSSGSSGFWTHVEPKLWKRVIEETGMESIALWKIKNSVKPLQVWSHPSGLSLIWSALLHYVVIPSPARFSGRSLSFPYRMGVQVAKPMPPFLISFVGKKNTLQDSEPSFLYGGCMLWWPLTSLHPSQPQPSHQGAWHCPFLLHFPLAASPHSWRNCLLSTLKCFNKKSLACVVKHWFLLTCC